MKQKEKKAGRKILLCAVGIVTTVAGFIVVPPLIERYGSKLYKASLKNDEIDFESMGPEIVKNDPSETEEGD